MGCCCSKESERAREIQRKKDNEGNLHQEDNREIQSETITDQPKETAKSSSEFMVTKGEKHHEEIKVGMESDRGKKKSAPSTEADRHFDMERAKKAIKPLTELSLNLYKKIAANNPSENVVISPICIALALALAESGANGATRTALRNALGGNDNDFDTSGVYRSIQRLLWIQEGETSLIIANGLFHDLEFKLTSKYSSKAKECFDAEIDRVDFKNNKRAATSRINSWISNQTGGRIKDLIKAESITELTAVVLVNAIYSKAKWRKAFRTEAIKTMPFYRQGQNANPQQVAFLTDEDDYMYADDTDFHAVGIPYSSISQPLVFFIILPKERDGIRKVEEQLTEAKFRSIVQTRERCQVDLRFPKFVVRTPVGLKHILSELGLGPIFEEMTADFSRMSNQPLHVSDVIHEAYIKVDEFGTEAAAATALTICLTSMRPIQFVADHPFIVAIVHQQTETVVFMAKVNHVGEVM